MTIRDGRDLRDVREGLGWSLSDMARALQLDGTREKGSQRVREMESGARPITGPVAVAVEAFAAGFRPADFVEPERV